MYPVFKRELFSLLNSLMAYIAIGIFLLAAGLMLWFFPDTSVFEYGYAELTGFFTLAPFLFLFLIPAITMRSFAEERREGTYVLLATRPITEWQIILAKFLSCLIIVFFALIPTVVYYITIYKLSLPEGNVDGGAILGSYIGLLLLSSAYTALGIFSSSITKNQVVAFAISVFLCFIAYSGFDAMSKVFELRTLESLFLNLSINQHYQSISRGVLDSRDIAYFFTFVVLFLGLTKVVIGGRKW